MLDRDAGLERKVSLTHRAPCAPAAQEIAHRVDKWSCLSGQAWFHGQSLQLRGNLSHCAAASKVTPYCCQVGTGRKRSHARPGVARRRAGFPAFGGKTAVLPDFTSIELRSSYVKMIFLGAAHYGQDGKPVFLFAEFLATNIDLAELPRLVDGVRLCAVTGGGRRELPNERRPADRAGLHARRRWRRQPRSLSYQSKTAGPGMREGGPQRRQWTRQRGCCGSDRGGSEVGSGDRAACWLYCSAADHFRHHGDPRQ